MGDITVTNLTLVRDTLKDRALTAATEDSAGVAQDFIITPTKGMDKIIIEVEVADSHGSVTCKLGKGGTYWAEADLEWDCPENKTTIMHISDIARFMSNKDDTAGTEYPDYLTLTLTPVAGKQLTTNHQAKLCVIELP